MLKQTHSQSIQRPLTFGLALLVLGVHGCTAGGASSSEAPSTGGTFPDDGGATSGGAPTSSTATGGTSVGNSSGGAANSTGFATTGTFGGNPATGGVTMTTTFQSGGSMPTLGGTSNGSSGGTRAMAGTTATFGTKTTGGTASNGGANSAGTVATGGTKSVGGSVATAGSVATGGAKAIGGTTGVQAAVTVYLAGDSIVSSYTDTAATNDQAGWGQMLPPLFNSKVTFVNRGAGGRTAYWFYLEGALDKILSTIKAGDYLFIEFGTNDQNSTATFEVGGTTYPRLAEPALFKTQLKQFYLDPIKAKGATPVLVTPPPRNSAYCNGGNGLGAYATAMIELGAAENVLVIDNNAKTFAYVKAICPKPATAAQETFFFGKADGTIDGTHFQENGARKMAGFIADGIRASDTSLAAYLL